jgi:hypothetical protein
VARSIDPAISASCVFLGTTVVSASFLCKDVYLSVSISAWFDVVVGVHVFFLFHKLSHLFLRDNHLKKNNVKCFQLYFVKS